jgi:hypothetical protein
VTQLTSYFTPSPNADPRTRGSVRRASGFVQIAVTLRIPFKIAERRTYGASLRLRLFTPIIQSSTSLDVQPASAYCERQERDQRSQM